MEGERLLVVAGLHRVPELDAKAGAAVRMAAIAPWAPSVKDG